MEPQDYRLPDPHLYYLARFDEVHGLRWCWWDRNSFCSPLAAWQWVGLWEVRQTPAKS